MQSRSQLHCHRTWGYWVPLTSALFDERVNRSQRAARRRRHFVARWRNTTPAALMLYTTTIPTPPYRCAVEWEYETNQEHIDKDIFWKKWCTIMQWKHCWTTHLIHSMMWLLVRCWVMLVPVLMAPDTALASDTLGILRWRCIWAASHVVIINENNSEHRWEGRVFCFWKTIVLYNVFLTVCRCSVARQSLVVCALAHRRRHTSMNTGKTNPTCLIHNPHDNCKFLSLQKMDNCCVFFEKIHYSETIYQDNKTHTLCQRQPDRSSCRACARVDRHPVLSCSWCTQTRATRRTPRSLCHTLAHCSRCVMWALDTRHTCCTRLSRHASLFGCDSWCHRRYPPHTYTRQYTALVTHALLTTTYHGCEHAPYSPHGDTRHSRQLLVQSTVLFSAPLHLPP